MAPAEKKEVARESSKEALKEEINYLRKELAKMRYLIRMLPNANTSSNDISDTSPVNYAQNQTDMPSLTPPVPLFSTGNGGVQTNRQTDMSEATDVLGAVTQLKIELKQKFRKLTKQEFRVFSAIYMLEEQNGAVDYPVLANKLGLSETAIRDYIMKLIKKRIPLVKTKVNNKKVTLNIRQELRQLATLDHLVKMREPVFR